MMANFKTTVLGIGQLLMVAAFAYTKMRHGLPFTDAEATLVGGLLFSGVKGVLAADAKPKDPQ